MRAPINFAERVKGHKIQFGSRKYELGGAGGADNALWIFPKWNSYNVIYMEFNWEEETYVVRLARSGDGVNFHTTLSTFKIKKQYFKSFPKFNSWMVAQIDDLYQWFDKRI